MATTTKRLARMTSDELQRWYDALTRRQDDATVRATEHDDAGDHAHANEVWTEIEAMEETKKAISDELFARD